MSRTDWAAYLLKNWAVVVLIAALVIGMVLPLATGVSAPGFYFEVMLGGLMSGVLYSLVALGLVLIFKASGVFNFAQGAMVLFAALAVARMSEVMPLPVAFVLAIGVMAMLAWLIERLVLRHLVNQDAVVLLMATLGVSFFLDGFGQTIWGSDIYQIDTGLPKTPVLVAENIFQGGILINTEDLVAAAVAALLVIALALFFQKTPTGRALAGGGRRSPGRAVDRHSAESHLGDRLDRRRRRRAGGRRGVGIEARRAVLGVTGRAEGAAGRDPRRVHVGAGRDPRWADHRRRRKIRRGLSRSGPGQAVRSGRRRHRELVCLRAGVAVPAGAARGTVR